MEDKDYDKILGVSKDTNDKTIKHAFRQLACQYQPDKDPGNKKAEETCKRIDDPFGGLLIDCLASVHADDVLVPALDNATPFDAKGAHTKDIHLPFYRQGHV